MKLKAYSSRQNGQAAVEFALSVLIFLAFLLVLGDMGRICYNWVGLQYAVNEGARFGSLGNSSGAIASKVTTVAGGLGIKNVDVSFADSAGGATPGAPLTFYKLIGQTTVTLNPLSALLTKITGNNSGNYIVNVQALTRNEP